MASRTPCLASGLAGFLEGRCQRVDLPLKDPVLPLRLPDPLTQFLAAKTSGNECHLR